MRHAAASEGTGTGRSLTSASVGGREPEGSEGRLFSPDTDTSTRGRLPSPEPGASAASVAFRHSSSAGALRFSFELHARTHQPGRYSSTHVHRFMGKNRHVSCSGGPSPVRAALLSARQSNRCRLAMLRRQLSLAPLAPQRSHTQSSFRVVIGIIPGVAHHGGRRHARHALRRSRRRVAAAARRGGPGAVRLDRAASPACRALAPPVACPQC